MVHDGWTWGMGSGSVIGLLLVALVVAALLKYLLFR